MLPTMITAVKDKSCCMKEEIFGPMTCVIGGQVDQSLNSSQMPGYTQKVLKMSSGNGIRSSWGLWGICCMVYGICMVG